MNSPKRPAGPPPRAPPPARPPPMAAGAAASVKGVSELKRPPGPPPGASMGAVKPPPMAPPPAALVQTQQRPVPSSVKQIDAPKSLVSVPSSPNKAAMGFGTPNGPPPRPRAPGPRSLAGDFGSEEKSGAFPKAAPPKFTMPVRPTPPTRKAGAIAMFEPKAESVEPADKKARTQAEAPQAAATGPTPPMKPTFAPRGPRAMGTASPQQSASPSPGQRPAVPAQPGSAPPRVPPPRMASPKGAVMPPPGSVPETPKQRVPRPAPPRPQPPGIPDGQPFPPAASAQPIEKKGPAPVRPPPDRTQAPLSPQKELTPDEGVPPAKAPTSEPPMRKGRKPPPAEKVVKRRDRADPEFEESSDEEDGKRAKLVEQKTDAVLVTIDGKTKTANQAKDPKSVSPQDLLDNATQGLVLPPPQDLEIDFGSKLAKQLSCGRLSIRCIEGIDVKRQGDTAKEPRLDPWIKFKLGSSDRHPFVSTEVKRKQTTMPQFEDEIIYFNVADPGQYVFQEDLQLTIQLWNSSTLKDENIGQVTMSVVRFFMSPFTPYEENVPVYYPGSKLLNGKLKLEFVFEEARSGIMAMTLYSARGLRNVDPLSKQSPFAQLALSEHYKKKSSICKDGGTQPSFGEQEILMFVDKVNWINDLTLTLLDEDIGDEKPIGYTKICLLPYMNILPSNAKEEVFDLFYTMANNDETKKEIAHGEIFVKIRFLLAGKLTLHLDKARNLVMPEDAVARGVDPNRIDPYVQFTMDGQAIRVSKRSPADKDGGRDPVWKHSIDFDVVDQYVIEAEMFHQNPNGNDLLLGSVQISLLETFKRGNTAFWSTLKQKKPGGGIIDSGDLFMELKFSGPFGVAFPQLRPDIDSYDDKNHKVEDPQPDEEDVDDKAKFKPLPSTVPEKEKEKGETEPGDDEKTKVGPDNQQLVPAGQPAPPMYEDYVPEFTEEEIVAAFKFIDLDHNNFVGAKEIRHVLVCMGEMITDEEIDAMISLVDVDGDGQVSFAEFRAMVNHPDPGNADMQKEILMKKDQLVAVDAQHNLGVDLNAYQRQKEMTLRESKKKMLVNFAKENEVTFDYIKIAYQSFVDMPREQKAKGKVKFAQFCDALSVEPIAEYKLLHNLFDLEETGEADFREFLLSLMNFIDIDKEARMRFSFIMFDDKKTGYITKKEVEEILRGNHMISLQSVVRKADTVMRQATSTSTGAIGINELVVISKKFPNIMLPSIGITKS